MLWRILESTLGLCSLRTKAKTRGALPEKVFNSQKVDFSAGEKFFERCLSGQPSWPSPKPEDRMAIPLVQGAWTFCAREHDKLQTLFLGRVMQPSTVLIGHDWLPGEPVWMGVRHFALGCASAARAHDEICRQLRYLEISNGDKCFEQWKVHDLDTWQTMPT